METAAYAFLTIRKQPLATLSARKDLNVSEWLVMFSEEIQIHLCVLGTRNLFLQEVGNVLRHQQKTTKRVETQETIGVALHFDRLMKEIVLQSCARTLPSSRTSHSSCHNKSTLFSVGEYHSKVRKGAFPIGAYFEP